MAHPGTSPYKSTGGIRRLAKAMRYSFQGFKAALKYEAAFRHELALATLMIPAAFFVGRNALEIMVLILCVVLVLVVELLNSAIEALADALSVEMHPLLGRAKDLGSAAVMLSLFFTVATWITIGISRYLGHHF